MFYLKNRFLINNGFVCCFEYENEAKAFYEALKNRLNKLSLEVAEDKTKILYFGKNAYYDRNFNLVCGKPCTLF